jgi:hypothetical protein
VECGGYIVTNKETKSKDFQQLKTRMKLPSDGTFAERLLDFPIVKDLVPESFREWHQIAHDFMDQ